MTDTLDAAGMDLLFNKARTYNTWTDKTLDEAVLRAIWDLAKMGPTSANCSPARVVFVTSPEAKEKLRPCLAEGNVDKTMTAPVTAIIGHDMEFYEKLPELFPHTDARAWFVGNDALIADTAFRNGTLQGAYLIMAARALGYDCGPMSGFDPDKVNQAFFAGTRVEANFLCNIGQGIDADLFPQSPRMAFADACQVV